VADTERVANAIDVAERHLNPIVVVSALAGVTDDLVAATDAAALTPWPESRAAAWPPHSRGAP
jgi:aspartokinase